MVNSNRNITKTTFKNSNVSKDLEITVKPPPSEMYLRFIHLVKTIEATQPLPLLEPIEQKILEVICIKNINEERLSVKDLMSYAELASPATMHKHIHSMVDKGWVFLAPTEDARRKQLTISNATIKHFYKLGNAMKKAVGKP